MHSSYLEGDEAFDALYPEEIRRASRRFWTPVAIARRAASLLVEGGAHRVLDVGSGVGKFALVAGVTSPALSIVGVEHRAHLVVLAKRARDGLGARNVELLEGDATAVPWDAFDGIYVYNSFAENLFHVEARMDDAVDLGMARFAREVSRSYARLRAAKVGTMLVTFYGSSGRVPSSYALERVEAAGAGWLRVWRKRALSDDGGFFVEVGGEVEVHGGVGAE